MIVQKELDEPQVVDIVNSLLGDLTGDISALQADVVAIQLEQGVQNDTLDDHELRIDALEATNPEALRGMTDVDFGTLPNPAKDQYTVKYDNTSDTFLLLPDNSGMPEAPVDGLKYARKDEDWEEVKDY